MDAKLVNQIVEQVIAALKQSGAVAAQEPPHDSTDRAGAKPQAGGKPGAQYAPDWTFVKKAEAKSPQSSQKAFITAEMLQRRLAAGVEKGIVELAPNEFLTPGAKDLADELHLTVRKRQAPMAESPVKEPAPSSDPGKNINGKPMDRGPWALGLVLHKPSEKVRSLLGALGREGMSFTSYDQTDCSVCNLQRLCKAVAAGEVKRGIAIPPFAADAMLLAGKVKGVRAVQGTRPESVAAGLRHFGANVLVLEHAASTFHEMRAMIRLFATQPEGAANFERLMEAVSELERT